METIQQTFNKLAEKLSGDIHNWAPVLLGLSEEEIGGRYNKQSRTVKQIIGHMVDSASNNTHRIIHFHYRNQPLDFPDYANLGNNDRWIAIQNYQEENWENLVMLWKYINLHYAHLVKQVDPAKLKNIWITATGKEISMEEMILDYPRHFDLHIQEIRELIKR